MSFNLTVTEDEIQKTLNILANNVYPKSISLETIAKQASKYWEWEEKMNEVMDA